MSKKQLSIVIPSHNKTELLLQAVQSIKEDPCFDDSVELCISDNSDSNETSNTISRRYADDSSIVYRRSSDSPSLDENVHTAVNMASAEYVWIFGDDDLLIPSRLEFILKVISRDEFGIVVVNSQSFSERGVIEKQRHGFQEDKVYDANSHDNFLEELGGYLTYVPSIVIKKELWNRCFDIKNMGSYFSHLAIVLSAKQLTKAYFISTPVIQMRLFSQTWTDQHFRIWNINYPNIIWRADGYSNISKSRVVKLHPYCSIVSIMAARAYDRYNIEIFHTCIGQLTECSWLRKVILKCIALLPRQLFTSLYIFLIKSGIKKKNINFSPSLSLALLKG